MNQKPWGTIVSTILAVLFLLFLYSIAEVLLLLFIAILFSIYLGAITDSLQRRLSIPRGIGILVAVVLTGFGIFLVGYLIVPPVVEQTQALIQSLPALLQRWEAQLMALGERNPTVAQILGPVEPGASRVGDMLQEVGGYFRGFVPYVFSGITFMIHVVSVLVMGIFLALRPAMYREGFIILAPPVHRELVRDLLADLGVTLRAWIGGQLLAMSSLALFTWIGLELLRVPYALAFGVFTGVVAIVPFFGTLISTLLPALFVLGSGSVFQAFLVTMLGVVVHLVEANVIAPMIMERQVHLPPVLTLLSVLIMAHLLHVIGLLVAVPVLAVVMVVMRRIYVRRVLEGKGFRRAIRDQPIEIRIPVESDVLVHPVALETSVPALLEQ